MSNATELLITPVNVKVCGIAKIPAPNTCKFKQIQIIKININTVALSKNTPPNIPVSCDGGLVG